MERNFIEELKEFQKWPNPIEGLYLAFSGKTKTFVMCLDRPTFYKLLVEDELILVSIFDQGAWHDRAHMVRLGQYILNL
jgi:hypothetical protein